MAENCTHNCSSCGESCSSRTAESLLAPVNEHSKVGRVIAVVSGKGGVGKSLVTSLLACEMSRQGYKTAVLDADITGPSIPKVFGLDNTRADATDEGILPATAKNGTKIMSVNLLLEQNTAPVIWRGPVIAGAVKQFWTDVVWGDVDYMFVDMPPGTGDVPLTVFQSLPVDGVVIVTSPQELVGMIVEKAVNMASMMDKPVVAVVENMSYFVCPDCGAKHSVFGVSHVEDVAAAHGIKVTASLPIDPAIASACDRGEVDSIKGDWLSDVTEAIKAI